jgi:hypothetical protein
MPADPRQSLPPALRGGPNRCWRLTLSPGGTFVFECAARGNGSTQSSIWSSSQGLLGPNLLLLHVCPVLEFRVPAPRRKRLRGAGRLLHPSAGRADQRFGRQRAIKDRGVPLVAPKRRAPPGNILRLSKGRFRVGGRDPAGGKTPGRRGGFTLAAPHSPRLRLGSRGPAGGARWAGSDSVLVSIT